MTRCIRARNRQPWARRAGLAMAITFGLVAMAVQGASSVPPSSSTAASIVVSVAGEGTVKSTGATTDLNCTNSGGSGCVGDFTAGASGLTLSATASSGYTFKGYRSQGGAFAGCSGGASCTLSKASGAEYVTAVFEKDSAVNPLVLYTDITSGPNTGGENNDGIYLTVFGKNFGTGLLGRDVKVYVNDVEVKRYIGTTAAASRGRSDIQQIATQIGSLGRAAAVSGTAASAALPVKVIVSGRVSNPNESDPTFRINPGNIYFVATTGKDTMTMRGGDFERPFRTVQQPGFGLVFSLQPASVSGAYGRVRAGDFIVMRGGTYTDVGFGGTGGAGYFMQALNKSGCPVDTKCDQGGGESTGPITVMGYPGETAFIDRSNHGAKDRFGGGISTADSARNAQGMGAYWNVVNLKIENGFTDGAVNTQMLSTSPIGGHWRVVNNELTNATCAISTKCRAGGIAGSGTGQFWVGNHIHDVADEPDALTSFENHGIYIDSSGSFEIAYNLIENIPGGNGIQVYSGDPVDGVDIHHNIIHDIGKHALNLTNGSRRNFRIWNNLVYRTVYAGVRFNSEDLRGLRLYNNTFYSTGMRGDTPSSGVLTNDMEPTAGQLEIRNNIFWPYAGSGYNRGCCNADFAGTSAFVTNNLWFGAGPVPAFSSSSIGADPKFVNPAAGDFHLSPASPAIGAGSDAVGATVADDLDAASTERARTLRAKGRFDIGAFQK